MMHEIISGSYSHPILPSQSVTFFLYGAPPVSDVKRYWPIFLTLLRELDKLITL